MIRTYIIISIFLYFLTTIEVVSAQDLQLKPGSLSNSEFVIESSEKLNEHVSSNLESLLLKQISIPNDAEPSANASAMYRVIQNLVNDSYEAKKRKQTIRNLRDGSKILISGASGAIPTGGVPWIGATKNSLISIINVTTNRYFDSKDDAIDIAIRQKLRLALSELSKADQVRFKKIQDYNKKWLNKNNSEKIRAEAGENLTAEFFAIGVSGTLVDLSKLSTETSLPLQQAMLHRVGKLVVLNRIDLNELAKLTEVELKNLRSEVQANSSMLNEYKKRIQKLETAIKNYGSSGNSINIESIPKDPAQRRKTTRSLINSFETSDRRFLLSGMKMSEAEFVDKVISNEASLGTLSNRLNLLAKKQREAIEQVQKHNDIQDGLIYSLLPANKKAEMLRKHRSFMSNVFKGKNRINEAEKQDAIAAIQRNVTALQEVQNVTVAVSQIMNQLPIKDPDDAKRVRKGLAAVHTAASIAIAYYAPSPATIGAAAASVAGLAGKPQKDTSTELILNRLNQLDKRLIDVLTNQEAIITNQQKIFELINGVAERQNFRLTNIEKKLSELANDLDIIKTILKDNNAAQILNYSTFMANRQNYIQSKSLVSNYLSFSMHYKQSEDDRRRLWDSIRQLSDQIRIGNDSGDIIDPAFGVLRPLWRLKTYTKAIELEPDRLTHSTFESKGYSPLASRLFSNDIPDDVILKRFENLTIPLQSFEASKNRHLSSVSYVSSESDSFGPRMKSMYGFQPSAKLIRRVMQHELIHANLAKTYLKYAFDACLYLECTQTDQAPQMILPKDRFLSKVPDDRARRSERIHRHALFILDCAIAQHAVRSGESSLRHLQRQLNRELSRSTVHSDDLGSLLSINERAWNNLFSLYVNTEIDDRRITLKDWRHVYKKYWSRTLRHSFGDDENIELNNLKSDLFQQLSEDDQLKLTNLLKLQSAALSYEIKIELGESAIGRLLQEHELKQLNSIWNSGLEKLAKNAPLKARRLRQLREIESAIIRLSITLPQNMKPFLRYHSNSGFYIQLGKTPISLPQPLDCNHSMQFSNSMQDCINLRDRIAYSLKGFQLVDDQNSSTVELENSYVLLGLLLRKVPTNEATD